MRRFFNKANMIMGWFALFAFGLLVGFLSLETELHVDTNSGLIRHRVRYLRVSIPLEDCLFGTRVSEALGLTEATSNECNWELVSRRGPFDSTGYVFSGGSFYNSLISLSLRLKEENLSVSSRVADRFLSEYRANQDVMEAEKAALELLSVLREKESDKH